MMAHADVRFATVGLTAASDVSVSHFDARHMVTGIELAGSIDARLEELDLRDLSTGVIAGDGVQATVRGTVRNLSGRAIRACNWGSEACGVDAAYIDWGDSDGPFPATGDALVCGAVTLEPWVNMPSDRTSDMYSSPNCDGTSTPDTQLADAQSAFSETLSLYQSLCALSQDACDQVERMQHCYSAALGLARAGSGFPIPVDAGDWRDQGMKTTIEAGGLFLQNSAATSYAEAGFGAVAARVGSILRVVDVALALTNAYRTCR